MTAQDITDALSKYPPETKCHVGPKLDDCTLAQQVSFDIAHYLDPNGVLVEDASLCIISEKR